MYKYIATWNAPIYEPKQLSLQDTSFFSENNGYNEEDIKAINKLWIGDTWISEDGCHTVEKIQIVSSKPIYY